MLQHSQWTIVLNFGVRGDITDVITHIKLSVNRFRGFGAVTPRNRAISTRLADGTFNSVINKLSRRGKAVDPISGVFYNITIGLQAENSLRSFLA